LCDYKEAHEHKGVKCALDKTSYEQIDASNHIKIYDRGDEYCSCGEVVKEYPVKRITESHTFVNDKCTGCGYAREQHVHEASIVEEPSTIYEQKDGSNHVVVNYGGYKQCSCGYVILMGETTRTYEKHSYVVGNVCSKCGYVSTGGALNQVLEEAVEGNFSENSSLWGIAGQIIVGEIPGVGTAADVRDCLADISNWESSWGHAGETILDCSGLIPIIGAVKYVDDIAAVASKTDDVAAVVNKADDIGAIIHKADDVIGSTINKTDDLSSLFNNLDEIDEILAKVDPDSLGLIRRPSNTLESFNDYDAFKREFGSAGKGMEWHHIVGQTQINRADFITSNMVNSTDNIIALDKKTHQAITTMYNKLVPGTKMKYYEWLAEQPFEIQYEYGLEALEDALRETGKIK
jgi:hypothetical protein